MVRRTIPPLSLDRRAEVQVQLREMSEPDFDYFLLVALSSTIATLGLITNSAAVIIGAMLVAPLMSPILGVGLASVTGDSVLYRHAVSALLRGFLFAVAVALLLTLSSEFMPFNPILNPTDELPIEILARTRPSPFDLGVAIAGGLAAAYALAQPQLSAALPGVAIATALMPPLCTVGIGVALGNWPVAGGSLLLFVTNLAAIAFAGVLTFLGLGFRPVGESRNKQRRIPRSLMVSAALVALLLIPLVYVSDQFVRQGREEVLIREAVRTAVTSYGAELVSVDTRRTVEGLRLDLTVRSEDSFRIEDVRSLQSDLAVLLQQSVELTLTVIPTVRLDPLIPPTPSHTPTPGPTTTPTHTPSSTPTSTFTPTASATSTFTPTPTSTPAVLLIENTGGLGLNLRAEPDGLIIGRLRAGARVLLLQGEQIVRGLVWVPVIDSEGRTGWIPLFYTRVVTLTPTITPSATPTP